ncbi:MAG TPA: hypothetical protein VG994_09230 [Steroidobacteraceae bacterium]|nr:hypothetical protein [Steroidobacteraceae bacterium]
MRIPSSRFAMVLLPLGLPFVAGAAEPQQSLGASSSAQTLLKRDTGPLIDKVRRATARYRDVNVAMSEGWVPGTPCVSGPNTGAMGVHFLLKPGEPGNRLDDGELDPEAPEALIYEPLSSGALRLVGVEFIVKKADWEKHHSGPGVLDGHLMNYVGAPNRYGLPEFYEIHVWAWEDNPEGAFADWNTRVTCNKQTAE